MRAFECGEEEEEGKRRDTRQYYFSLHSFARRAT
jgi:hypothetical protein